MPPPARPSQAFGRARIPEHAAAALPDRKPPAWAFLHGLKSPLSSTALRALRREKAGAGKIHEQPPKQAEDSGGKPASGEQSWKAAAK